MPGYRTGTTLEGGRERTRRPRWRSWTAVLAIATLFSTVPASTWTHPAGVAGAQEETAGGDMALPGQVIAQGMARLPQGELAWTVRSIEAPGGEGIPIAAFPIGFVIADGASIAVLDAEGEVLNILADDEAAFLPEGSPGALASREEDVASLYEVALVSGRDDSSGEPAGTIVGSPFAAPTGAAFDIELARASLDSDEQTTIPISRSGAPVLYLQTAGATQLQAEGGQTAELAAGQFAVLLGEVLARGTSDEPATFLVAAIGEAAATRDTTEGTPEARASREDRQRARDETVQSDDTSGAERTRERRPRRVRTGGGGRGGGGQGGTGAAPVTGGVSPTAPVGVPAGTPPVEPTVEATLPVDPTVPDDGTPPPDPTTPAEDEVPADATETPDPSAPAEDEVPTEEPTSVEPSPTVEAPPAEDALPTEEVPAEEAPAEEPPVVEEPVAEPTAGA